MNPSSDDEEEDEGEEEGLPSPPLDEGAFFTPQASTMELSRVKMSSHILEAFLFVEVHCI